MSKDRSASSSELVEELSEPSLSVFEVFEGCVNPGVNAVIHRRKSSVIILPAEGPTSEDDTPIDVPN
jgi:hypothetical protein